MELIQNIENILINFFYGSNEAYIAWLTATQAKLDNAPFMIKWISGFLAQIPTLGVLLCCFVVFALIYLVVHFFHKLVSITKNDDSDLDDNLGSTSGFRRKRGFKRRKRGDD